MARRIAVPFITVLAALTAVVGITPASSQSAGSIDQVVQLGDSYSAGFGALSSSVPADGGSCDDSTRSRPSITPGGQLASGLGVPLVFAACGGAEIPDVVNQYRAVVDQIPGDGSGTLVVFTAGGNDLRTNRGESWVGLVTRCILWDWSCEKRSRNQVANETATANALEALVAEITSTRPGATVRVLGYPELMQRTPGCSGMTGIDRNEADYMDRIARSLNDSLEAAVNRAAAAAPGDVSFVNPEAAFDDRGACQTGSSGLRYVNDVDFVPWSLFSVAANSLHTTASGYDAYANVLANSL